MHIFSLCIIDEPRSAHSPSLNLGADHRVMHILSLMTIFIYCLLKQNMLFVTFFLCFCRCNKSGRKWISLQEVFKVICQYNYVYFRNISSVATTKSWFSLHASALCKVLKTSRVTTLFSFSPLFTILYIKEIE